MLKIRNWRVIAQALGVMVVGGGIAVAATTAGSAAPAIAGTANLNVHQANAGITAANFNGHETCPGIPPNEDGWHFVLRQDNTSFVSITVVFSTGTVTSTGPFGPPTDKHAFVASPAGAVLINASATVSASTGTLATTFELTGTCPATTTTSPSPSTSPSPHGSPSGSPSASPSGSPRTSPAPSTSPTSPASAPTPTPVHTTLPVTG